MGRRERRERRAAAYVIRQNGAWLISIVGEVAHDSTPEETYSCARSLATAKRVAISMAKDFGFTGAVRWEQWAPGGWRLEMAEVTEEFDGNYDDD